MSNTDHIINTSDPENPLVSIVITTYKRPDTLTRALESVLKQSYRPIEIIVVDDNNEGDEYRKQVIKVMEPFVNEYGVIYIQHKTNLNGAAARNTAIDKARGKYITFLDDDDFFMPKRIEQLVNTIKNNKSASCVYSGVAFMQNNRIINIRIPKKYDDYVYEILCQNSFFGTGSNFLCVTDSVRAIGGFDDRFARHQDMEFMIRYIKKFGLIHVANISVVKSISGWSNAPKPDSFKVVKELFLSKFKELIDEYPDQLRNNIYYVNYLELIKSYVFNRQIIDPDLLASIESYGKYDTIARMRIRIEFMLRRFSFIKKGVNFIRSLVCRIRNKKNVREVYDILDGMDL